MKVEFSGEVEEMQTVVTVNHAEARGVEEVEHDTLVGIEKGMFRKIHGCGSLRRRRTWQPVSALTSFLARMTKTHWKFEEI